MNLFDGMAQWEIVSEILKSAGTPMSSGELTEICKNIPGFSSGSLPHASVMHALYSAKKKGMVSKRGGYKKSVWFYVSETQKEQ